MWSALVVTAAILLTAIVSVLPPLFVGRIIDALGRHDFREVFQELIAYIIVTLLLGLIQLIQSVSSTVFRESITRNLRVALLEKLYRVQLGALASVSPGAISNRASGGISALAVQLQYAIFPTIQSVCMLLATVVAMLRLNIPLACVTVVAASLALLPPRVVVRPTAALQKRQAEAMDKLTDELQESSTLQALTLFRNPSAAGRRLEQFSSAAREVFRFGVFQSLMTDGTAFVSTLINTAGPIAIMAAGALLAGKGEISVGIIVSALIYQSRVAGPFGTLAHLQLTFATARVVTDRLLDILDLPDECSGKLQFVPGAICMRHVTVVRKQRITLDDVLLDVPARSHIAIVGPSGAGKSTLASLLTRLTPYSGNITLGGVDLADLDLDSLRSNVAIVAQDPLILNASLRENLTLLGEGISEVELAQVVALCALEDVVNRLPLGMATMLGHRGFHLSGGERQRICLARAILQDPAVLVLDEALSGVDMETESCIVASLRERFRERMMAVITHRITTIAGFDRVFVLRDGRLVQSSPNAAATPL